MAIATMGDQWLDPALPDTSANRLVVVLAGHEGEGKGQAVGVDKQVDLR